MIIAPPGSHRGDERREHRREEPYDSPEEHREIENRRFQGGLTPAPELYARAREQWYRLPGSVIRPSMDPVVGVSDTGQQDLPGEQQPGKKKVRTMSLNGTTWNLSDPARSMRARSLRMVK
jgi:hypothetical protein